MASIGIPMKWNNPFFNLGLFFFFSLILACGGGDDGSSDLTGNSDVVVGNQQDMTEAGDSGGNVLSGDVVEEDVAPEVPPCVLDTDCDAGEVCDCAGVCQSGGTLPCVEDKNCGSGSYCDVCWGFCRPLKGLCEPCVNDGECDGVGSACLDLVSGARVCGLACLSDVGCPVGYSCLDIENLSSSQCVPDSGNCEVLGECALDEDCPFPQICNVNLLVCAPGCADDEGCPVGQVCHGGHCIEACDDQSNPCPAGQQCEDGHCSIPGGCVDSADCEEPETYCDLTTSMCVDGCQLDADCKASAQECVNGSCQEKGCTGNFFCAFGQVCNQTTGKCEEASGPYCAECDPNNDTNCQAASSDNLCIGFQGEEGEELGDYCLVACGPDSANPCPQGYACEEVDVDGTPQSLCVRNCPVPPVGL